MMNCVYCEDTGFVKVPNDEEKFDKEFERLDGMGSMTWNECREKALEYSGYTLKPCTSCSAERF